MIDFIYVLHFIILHDDENWVNINKRVIIDLVNMSSKKCHVLANVYKLFNRKAFLMFFFVKLIFSFTLMKEIIKTKQKATSSPKMRDA